MKRQRNLKAYEAFKAHQREGRAQQVWQPAEPATQLIADSGDGFTRDYGWPGLEGRWLHLRTAQSLGKDRHQDNTRDSMN